MEMESIEIYLVNMSKSIDKTQRRSMVSREGILPAILRNDDPDRGVIDEKITYAGDPFPKLVRRDNVEIKGVARYK
jgi:hypothetical protein